MKKVFNNKIITAILFALFATAGAPAALGNDSSRIIPGIELKLLGDFQHQTVFQMTLASGEEEEFTIVIRDLQGNLVFKDKVTGSNLTRKFRLENSDDTDDGSLLVEIKTKKGNKSQVYQINKNGQVLQETGVAKIR